MKTPGLQPRVSRRRLGQKPGVHGLLFSAAKADGLHVERITPVPDPERKLHAQAARRKSQADARLASPGLQSGESRLQRNAYSCIGAEAPSRRRPCRSPGTDVPGSLIVIIGACSGIGAEAPSGSGRAVLRQLKLAARLV